MNRRPLCKLGLCLTLALSAAFGASPVDFATAELNAAMADRKLRARNVIEVSLDAPESFRIEPYTVGGAHITGGDLRGLMYGLLEAAEQIRTTGRFSRVAATPAAPFRGARIELTPALEAAPQSFWDEYFRMLARQRFNRVHVVIRTLEAPYPLLQMLSRTAADYAVDFTLGLDGAVNPQELTKALMVCTGIRGVAIEPGIADPASVFTAIRLAGRRVTLDLDGATSERKVLDEASASSVPLMLPPSAWPPSIEVDAPVDAANPTAHEVFYWMMGRLAFDPKAKAPKEFTAAEFTASRDAGLWMAAAQQSNLGGSDFIASPAEAARNQSDHRASAKFTPPVIAEHLEAAAAALASSVVPDLAYLARLARRQAEQQRSVAALDLPAVPPRPMLPAQMPVASAPSEQPLAVTLKLSQPKSLAAVRLHYRTTDPSAATKTIELPPAPEVTFTIPAADITGNWDLRYFFEILHPAGAGWFAPDPLAATPYWTIHIIAPHTGRN